VIFLPLEFPDSGRVMTVLSSVDGKAFKPSDSLYVEWRGRRQSFDRFAAALLFRRVLRDSQGAREIPVAAGVPDAANPLRRNPPARGVHQRLLKNHVGPPMKLTCSQSVFIGVHPWLTVFHSFFQDPAS